MLGDKQSGVPFHGEVFAPDTTAGTAFILYDSEANVIAVGVNDRVVITAYSIVVSTSMTVTLTGGSALNGANLRSGAFGAGGGMAGSNVELPCKKGFTPKITGSVAGTVNAQIEGRLFRH